MKSNQTRLMMKVKVNVCKKNRVLLHPQLHGQRNFLGRSNVGVVSKDVKNVMLIISWG